MLLTYIPQLLNVSMCFEGLICLHSSLRRSHRSCRFAASQMVLRRWKSPCFSRCFVLRYSRIVHFARTSLGLPFLGVPSNFFDSTMFQICCKTFDVVDDTQVVHPMGNGPAIGMKRYTFKPLPAYRNPWQSYPTCTGILRIIEMRCPL